MQDSVNINYSLPEPWKPADIGRLLRCGEFLAAGFLAQDGSPLQRMASGWRAQLEHAALPAWRGEVLYPAGAFSWFRQGSAVSFDYSYSLVVDGALLAQRQQDAHPQRARLYHRLGEALGGYPASTRCLDPDLTLGGNNYTHAILNYGRAAREGLAAY